MAESVCQKITNIEDWYQLYSTSDQ